MMKLLFKTLLVLLFVGALAQTGKAQINFTATNWQQALKQASAQKKLIFVDAYATWCGPCKMLKATTFRDKQVAEYFNKNFVNAALDMEQGNNPSLAQQWGMRAYPTLIICNSKGEVILNTVGYINAKDLMRFAQDALASKTGI
ncbi:thioredoxin domain-containing protein [Mucilaginibacter sp. PAMB04168]|uniref:thioredoxin family protein n=1 Tax=Mucilaginibacter sp. PAMB04168 TaxID=3138567 RepID=UPI0031F6DC73